MSLRAIAVWLLILLLANLNGAFRELLLKPLLGEPAGHLLSTVLLSAAVLAVARATIAWIGPRSASAALAVGGLWLLLTLAFEFLAGHYLFGSSWPKLLADYDLLHGRIWVLVLLTTLLAPLWAERLRRA